MERVLGCKDVGVDCPFVAHGKTDEEVLKIVSDHAVKQHGIPKVTKEYLDSWRKKIHNG